MPRDIKTESALQLRFPGGVNARMSIDDIDPGEAAEGENFDLDIGNFNYKPRKGFELLFTAANAGEIRGFITLKKRDGTVHFAVQAGNTVYSWDGTTATSIGTVPSTACLRGRERAYWQLDDLVIITDINLVGPVFTWDGTTFTNPTFPGFSEFRAKHCVVDGDRAFYANVWDQILIPQLVSVSGLEDFLDINLDDRTGSTLQPSDSGFMTVPDLRAINGQLGAFGAQIYSTEDGQIHILSGSDATDFAISSLFINSGASGEEPIVNVGNDVLYGREGRIESLSGVLEFGDVESDDTSLLIEPLISNAKQWTVNYDSTNSKAYAWPDNENKVYVWKKDMPEVSAWVPWTTKHSSNFKKTASMECIDPRTGRRGVFWGDKDGNVYLMESGNNGDAGTAIASTRTSALFSAPLDAAGFDFSGFVDAKSTGFPVTLTFTLLAHGTELTSFSFSKELAAPTDGGYYGGDSYYGGGSYYGSLGTQRFQRYKFEEVGRAERVQIKIEAETTQDFELNQYVLRFGASSETT